MKINITNNIYWLGVNDRHKHLFENIWPLPQGVAYNSYLITDKKTALIDTVDFSVADDYITRLKDHLQSRNLDYLIINHMEPDHAGMIGILRSLYPEVKIVGNKKTFKLLENFFGIHTNLHEVADGDILDLGTHKLRFTYTPWVHWPETMMTYEITEEALFSGDAFGSFGALNGGIFDDEINFNFYEDEMRRYYSNIVGQYSNMVQKALSKLREVSIRIICPTHGPVWRSAPSRVIGLYDRWSKYESNPGVVIACASMYGHTEKVADYLARRIAEQGVRDIKLYDVSSTHVSYLLSDIWNYSGLLLGSCAYNSNAHPLMEHLCAVLSHIGLKHKHTGLFGSYSWSGGGVKSLKLFADSAGLVQVAEAIEIAGSLTASEYASCDTLASAMAAKVLGAQNT
jgi:flavorubredoxin